MKSTTRIQYKQVEMVYETRSVFNLKIILSKNDESLSLNLTTEAEKIVDSLLHVFARCRNIKTAFIQMEPLARMHGMG